MAHIDLSRVTVEFPVFNAVQRSLKNRILGVATGGILSKRHDGVVIVRALDNVTLDIQEGTRLGIVGHNGAGKTTLLRLLGGIFHPTQGSLKTEGNCVSLINIGLGIDPEATGRENIKLRAAMMGAPTGQMGSIVEDVQAFADLGDFLDLPFRTYSSGMQLRLAFAASTAIKSEILIMDEWLSLGDEGFRTRSDTRLRKMVDATRILVLASHSKELLLRNCTRLIWLEHGRIRMDGDVASVADAYFDR